MSDAGRGVSFTLEEIAALIEDLMRIADDLLRAGDEVNAFLLDQVVNRLLERAFGADGSKRASPLVGARMVATLRRPRAWIISCNSWGVSATRTTSSVFMSMATYLPG